MEGTDIKNKRFTLEYLQFLGSCKTEGLIELTEQKQSELAMAGNMGTRLFTSTWTPKAISMRDTANSDNDWLRIPLGSCKIKTIVKDIEYHHPNLPQSDDFRLIVGTYERTCNTFGKEQGVKDEVFKFRALIRANPFNQTYSYQTADWGALDAGQLEDTEHHSIMA